VGLLVVRRVYWRPGGFTDGQARVYWWLVGFTGGQTGLSGLLAVRRKFTSDWAGLLATMRVYSRLQVVYDRVYGQLGEFTSIIGSQMVTGDRF